MSKKTNPLTYTKICGLTRPEDLQAAITCGANALGFVFYPRSPRCVLQLSPQAQRALQLQLEHLNTTAPTILRVGVFVNADEATILEQAKTWHLNQIQLHGHESPDLCGRIRTHYPVWKALPLKADGDIAAALNHYAPHVDGFVLDTPAAPHQWGGTGESGDWALAAQAIQATSRPVILAGGLGPHNVANALHALQAAGVASLANQVNPVNQTNLANPANPVNQVNPTNLAGLDASSRLEQAPGQKCHATLQAFFEAIFQYTQEMIPCP